MPGVREHSNPMDFPAKWENSARGIPGTFAKPGAANGGADICAATSSFPLGVLQNDPALGEGVTIRPFGRCRVIAGVNNLALNDPLMVDSAGRVIKYLKNNTYPTGITYRVGIALQASTAVDQAISAWIWPQEANA